MAIMKPFRAYRPAPGMEARIAALPYDVYNRQEAKEVVLRNPDSFLAIDRAESQFSDEVDTYADEVYAKAASMIQERIQDGRFIQEDKPAFYLYELTMDGRCQTGIVGCASIDEYQNGVIKKHENTRADKEEDRIRHVDTTNMQTGPIFLAYRQTKELAELIASVKETKTIYDFVSEDQIRHRVWVINEAEEVTLFSKAFSSVPNLYIADGHHRCASAVKVGLRRREQYPEYSDMEEFNYFLSVVFPDEELKIMDYNRVVKDLNGLSKEAFLNAVSNSFVVNKATVSPYAPVKKGQFGMYLDHEWYILDAKDFAISDDSVKGLDVSILQDYLLEPILGIQDPKTDKRIDFVGGIRGLGELERRANSDMQIAFSMYPTSISELFAVADEGRLMPPKSTWFEPKLRSGIFLHDLEGGH